MEKEYLRLLELSSHNTMIEVIIKAGSRYPIRRKRIKSIISKTLEAFFVYKEVHVDVHIVGDRRMKTLKNQHLGENETTDVLSFPLHENFLQSQRQSGSSFVEYPDGKLSLGSIVISYPQAQRQANVHKLKIDDEIDQLVEHGILHLLGIHHA